MSEFSSEVVRPTRRRARTRSRSGVLCAIVGIAIAVVAVGVAAAGDSGAESAVPSALGTEPSDELEAPTDPSGREPVDTPLGKIPVATSENGQTVIAGFVDESAEGDPEGYPRRSFGSDERTFGALEVTDAEGRHVGYFIEALGFVDLEAANDAAVMDRLIAADDEDLARALRRAEELREDGVVPPHGG